VPFTLLLLALFETGGGPAWAVHVAGAGLLVARGLHALGLTRSSTGSATDAALAGAPRKSGRSAALLKPCGRRRPLNAVQ